MFTNKNNLEDEHELLFTIEKDKIQLQHIPIGKIEIYQGNKRSDKSILNNNLSFVENVYELTKRKILIVFLVLLLIVFYINSTVVMPWNATGKIQIAYHSNVTDAIQKEILHPLPSGFLVWSDKCKIPDIDPHDQQVMKYFKRQNYETCSSKKPFTNVQFNISSKQYTLNINETLKLEFGSSLDCCYQAIIRNQTGKNADKKIKLGECLSFNKTVQISNTIDNILVKCNNNNQTQVYIHGHPMMPERSNINNRLDAWKMNNTKRAPSILMIGIDSVSRINVFRAMTKTAEKLKNRDWFEISGYNKMGDNTFPNLMAILTGYNSTSAYRVCNPKKKHKLDDCPIIWKLFQDHGYITAYAEDEVLISTFNYLKLGFEFPPVDYYLRPFMIAAEQKFSIRKKSGLKFCLGYQHSADYIYDYALELATRYKFDPFFGLFWANTFSHSGISDCSSMDTKVVKYLEELSTRGILNESVVIFFSDHGMRWGRARNTISGYFEERLPFMFIWLPQWLKTKYPELVNGLIVNKNRLTNPYDIHMTLKNLLELSGRTTTDLPKATDCPNCQSLLKPVPYNRSCQDIAITEHWCTCVSYQSIDTKLDLVHKLALFVVGYLNHYIESFKNASISKLCENFQLNNIVGAYQVNMIENNYPKNVEGYRVVLTTTPGNALFEATIRRKKNNGELQITGSISRLNSYASDSKCITDSNAKLYCYCSKNENKNTTIIATTKSLSDDNS